MYPIHGKLQVKFKKKVTGKKKTTLIETDEHIYMFNKQPNKHETEQMVLNCTLPVYKTDCGMIMEGTN